MALVKDSNVENVINEAAPGSIIKAEHIDTLASKVLYQKNVQTGDSLPDASGYSEGDIFTVQSGNTYKHNGSDWVKLIEDTGVKVYRALVSQTGTDAPTAIVLENSLGGDIVFSRANVGLYDGTLNGAFPEDKTNIQNKKVVIHDTVAEYWDKGYEIFRLNDNTFRIAAVEEYVLGDSLLEKVFVEIIVYP